MCIYPKLPPLIEDRVSFALYHDKLYYVITRREKMRKFLIFLFILFFLISFQVSSQTWSSLKRLTWNSGDSQWPAMTADSANRIHVVWYDDFLNMGIFDIFYKRSLNGGDTWSGITRMTWSPSWSITPSIAADSGTGIHVVWRDSRSYKVNIFYKKSTNSGGTWSGITQLTWTSTISSYPSIAIDTGGRIHMVWQDQKSGNTEIFYKRSTNGGNSWSATTRLSWSAGNSNRPFIAADPGGGIHVAWPDDTPGNKEIYYKRSANGGVTWSALTRLTWNSGDSISPSIAAYSSIGIVIAWEDDTPGKGEIFSKRSTDGGATWTGFARLTWNTENSTHPSIAADTGAGIHLAWHNYLSGNNDIYYKSSPNGGVSWSAPIRVTWKAYWAGSPILDTDSGDGIHIVWQDLVSSYHEIYYKNRK